MKICLSVFALLALSLLRAAPPAAGDFAAVRAADEQRLAATISGDTGKLSELLSDDLRYAFSNGRVQTKPEFLAAVANSKIKYLSITPQDIELRSISPDAVTMQGRARLEALAEGRRAEFTLQFLAVWRLEGQHWRLFAYQSSQLAEAR